MSDKKTLVKNSILIRGEEIPTTIKFLRQEELRFFVDNPRIYSIMHAAGKHPTQDEIQRKLLTMDHVKALIDSIKLDGGLTDPIIVRDEAYEVLEGNSRLAAYRALAQSNPIKWGQVKCCLIPRDLDEKLIFALLGQYHITGKKDWAPFEQAGFLYRRHKQHKIAIDQLAREIGLGARTVSHLIKTYQFMHDHEEVDTARWSYYDAYLKNNKIKAARTQHTDFDNLVVGKIKSGEIERAVDVRDQLPLICALPKILQKFTEGKIDFEEAHEQAIESGADTKPLQKVKNFRSWLARSEVRNSIKQLHGEPRNKIEYEIKKLVLLATQLQKNLQSIK